MTFGAGFAPLELPLGEEEAFRGVGIVVPGLLAVLIALNLNALTLPLLFAGGNGLIRIKNWFAIKNLELKRKGARR